VAIAVEAAIEAALTYLDFFVGSDLASLPQCALYLGIRRLFGRPATVLL
jgi:hypothetical protein